MRVPKFCFILISLSVFVSLGAQDANYIKSKKDSLLNEITDVHKRLKQISVKDSTTGFSAPLSIDTHNMGYRNSSNMSVPRDSKGLLIVPNNWVPFADYTSFSDTIIFEPAFLPIVFDGKILPQGMDFRSNNIVNSRGVNYHLISPDSTFAPLLSRAREIQEMRRYYYQRNPMLIKLNALTFGGTPIVEEAVVKSKNPFKEILSTDDPIEVSTPDVEKYKIKKVFWMKKVEHSLQINQNSLSDNWVSGGDNNLNVINYHRLDLNYKKNKITFSNITEWKLNFQTIPGDSLHNTTISADFFRTYSVFGIEAYKKWSYTVNMLMNTPLFNSYVTNKRQKSGAIFSPLTINVGIGMRYALENVSKKDKYRKLNFSADLAPLSLNYTFVGDRGVNEARFGIEEGRKSKADYGMTAIMNSTYSFNRFANFNSRFKYFTNYEKVLMEFENRFNMSLSKYLSTSVYLYIRYDDSVPYTSKHPTFGYFQYNEILGFGLNYQW